MLRFTSSRGGHAVWLDPDTTPQSITEVLGDKPKPNAETGEQAPAKVIGSMVVANGQAYHITETPDQVFAAFGLEETKVKTKRAAAGS